MKTTKKKKGERPYGGIHPGEKPKGCMIEPPLNRGAYLKKLAMGGKKNQ